MAIDILTGSEVLAEVRRRFGETTAATSSVTDNEIYALGNLYLQRLTRRMSQVLQGEGHQIGQGALKLDCWVTVLNSTTASSADNLKVTAATQQVGFPQNFDHPISLIDRNTGKKVHFVTQVNKYWLDRFQFGLDNAGVDPGYDTDVYSVRTGPPEYMELLGMATVDSSFRVEGKIWPAVPTGVTPNLELTYYRIPATIAAGTALDIDPKFQDLVIDGTVLSLLRDDDPVYERYLESERNMILELAKTAKWV